jgi:predicted Zn-dependent protease
LWVACLYQLRDYGTAADGLQALLSREPDQVQYWQQLGEAYAHAGDAQRALAVYALMYRQGLLRQAQDYLNLASLYLQDGEPFQAGQVLQDGLQSGALPATEGNYELLAAAWSQAHETERAVAALGEVAKLAQSGDAYLEQAQLYAARHDWISVIDTSRKALSKGQLRRPGHAWLLQGVALTQSRQYDEAANALHEAAKYDDSRSLAEAWLKYLTARGATS